jgi:hypothetical protein
MISIRIGDQEREFESADESWVTQQINRRRTDGLPACVKVTVRIGDLNLVLVTPTCASAGGRGRAPTAHEQEIFDLWNQLGLNGADFTGGNVVAFLKQLRRRT